MTTTPKFYFDIETGGFEYIGGTPDLITSGELQDFKTVAPQPRTLKELYILLLDSGFIKLGIGVCTSMTKLFHSKTITLPEYEMLSDDFILRRPRYIFGKIYWRMNIPDGAYWWRLNEYGKNQRIKFVKNIISKL